MLLPGTGHLDPVIRGGGGLAPKEAGSITGFVSCVMVFCPVQTSTNENSIVGSSSGRALPERVVFCAMCTVHLDK